MKKNEGLQKTGEKKNENGDVNGGEVSGRELVKHKNIRAIL